MKIELFYLEGCPNVRPTRERLRQVLQAEGLGWPIIEINVAAEEMARELRFLGSPTVHINGVDIEPTARQRAGYAMMCRVYEGSGGVPPEELVRSAIRAAEENGFRPS